MNSHEFLISDEFNGLRIDKWLSEQELGLTRSAIQKLIDDNNVYVNIKPVNKNYKLKVNDIVKVELPEPVELDVKAQNLIVEIVYQDEDLLRNNFV